MQKLKQNDILLRPIEQKDAEMLMELNNDLEIAKYLVGTPKIVTLEEQMLWMKKTKIEKNTKRLIVEYGKESVGTIIISNINDTFKTANINIKLKRNFHGKGIGKESIKLALQHCFYTMNYYCITAHVLPYNQASMALFESIGFSKEGILRSRIIKNNERYDLISYSITKEDYNKLYKDN